MEANRETVKQVVDDPREEKRVSVTEESVQPPVETTSEKTVEKTTEAPANTDG